MSRLYKSLLLISVLVFANKINAQNNPAIYNPAKFGNCVSFPGTSGNFIRFEDNQNWKPEPDLTLETWIRVNQPVVNPFQHISGNAWRNNGGLNTNWGFGFSFVQNRVGFHVIIIGSPTQQYETVNPADTFSTCQWYHIAGVKQGQQIRFYVNGELRATQAVPSGPIRTSNGGYATIGTNYESGFNNWFNGYIDEFRLWNYARNESEIRSTINDTLAGTESGLLAYYKFNESGQGPGITVKNSAPSGSQMNGISFGSNVKFEPSPPFPIPAPPTVISPINLCGFSGNTPISITAPLPGSNTRFRFYNADTNLLATTLGATFPVNIPAPGIYNFYAQIFNPNTRCVSPLTPVVVNNAPRPPAPLLTTDTICQPGSILLRALHAGSGNYTYRWFRINPTLAIGQSTSSTFSVASASPGQRFAVVYTAEGSNCASDTAYVTVQQGGFRQVNVTVNPMAVCQNGITTFTFSGLTTGQTVFIFADSLRQILIGTTVGNSSYQTPPISSNIRFYFSFQSDSNGCNVIPISLAITVLPKPVAPMLRVDTICGTATTVLRAFNALAPTGTLYNWYTGNPPVFIQQTLADTLSTNAQPGQTFAVAIVNSTTGCISDTIYATPPVGFKPLNVFALPDKVCPNGITSIFFSNLTQNQTAFIYADTLREIQLGSTQGPGTFITPPITSESRFYFTFEADSAGCFTKPFSLAIRVVNKPIVQWQSNLPKLICSTLADTQAYAVIGALNSRFEWYLPTGNIAMPIGRTDSSYILIKWIERTDSARVLVQEIGVDDCISDTISLTVQFENSSPKLERVTTALIDDKNIEVFHKTLSVKSAFKPEVFLYRDAELLAALPLIDDFYTDFDLNTGETAYTYHIKLINACGDTISSESITNTVLTKKREGDSFLLTWNGPTELNIPPYERSLNHNPSFSAEFQILEYINTTTNTAIWSFDNALNEPCFRMRFRINDNAEAKEVLSNRVCDLILPELMLPNLITANGDGVNDTFELKFIRFYQPITLEVFNRWGKKVYENAAYNNDWDVSSLPSGLYYYKINLSANQAYPKQQRVGWVQVVK